jgi:hypothetical protein
MIWGKLWGRLAVSMGDATLASLLERGHGGFRDSLSTAVEELAGYGCIEENGVEGRDGIGLGDVPRSG